MTAESGLKIVADENIPLITELFSPFGEVILLPGREITHSHIMDADILLVRSVTMVDKNLLANTRVKFVGSATAGTDHIDKIWLNDQGIAFADAKGANGTAVAEYVICCIAHLQQQGYLTSKKVTAGVIGVGHVGKQVVEKLKLLNFTTLTNDPPRAVVEEDFISTPLAELTDVDILCLHTPLIKTGPFPTYHLIDREFLQKLKRGCVLLNAGRGAVINSADLLEYGRHLLWCFDVWEHEPAIDYAVFKNAAIATPHIAGYTVEAKLHGTLILYQAAQQFFKLPALTEEQQFFPTIELDIANCSSWQEVLLLNYNPLHNQFRMLIAFMKFPDQRAVQFDLLRKHYQKRHEFASITLKNATKLSSADVSLLQRLNFKTWAKKI